METARSNWAHAIMPLSPDLECPHCQAGVKHLTINQAGAIECSCCAFVWRPKA